MICKGMNVAAVLFLLGLMLFTHSQWTRIYFSCMIYLFITQGCFSGILDQSRDCLALVTGEVNRKDIDEHTRAKAKLNPGTSCRNLVIYCTYSVTCLGDCRATVSGPSPPPLSLHHVLSW